MERGVAEKVGGGEKVRKMLEMVRGVAEKVGGGEKVSEDVRDGERSC